MDECVSRIITCDEAVATCVDTIGSASCECKEGYTLDTGLNSCVGKWCILCNTIVLYF